ncbi:hypothetical protein Adt_13784 [Abeliophyllum distichum]|uniref:Uncharacterized protein n=1 Tax=Abeliophyllum distichum TaxID=126358 RepID=A0ABD1TXT9_9LAMI
MPEDPLPHVSIPRRFGELAFRFKGIPALRLACPASGEGSSAQVPPRKASDPSQEVQDATPLRTIHHPSSDVQVSGQATVPLPLPSSSNPHSDSTLPMDKGKRIAKDEDEVTAWKRKAPTAAEEFMRDARKARRAEEDLRSSLPFDEKPEDAGNSASSAGQRSRVRIFQHRDGLPTSEKAAEEATVRERLQLAKMNLVRRLSLAKELFGAIESFDGEEAKSKKLSEDLKTMSVEKAQLESEKRVLQFKLDLVVTKEADMRAKYEIELKAAKECLKQA